ncbi:MAG TPA: nitrite reductase large subunit NirB [Motilibacteraceae bacterium]|nr:nitrite reductase large subunit NirB [Motilibacteraceae bacterium]
MSERTLLVVGAGMVAQRLVESLRARDEDRSWRVVVVGDESRAPYDRVALTSYVTGTTAEELSLVPQGFYDDDPDLALHLGERVVAVDRTACTVSTDAGRVLAYDALVLATGSAPFVPPVPGRDLPGCHVYRTLDDLDGIRADLRDARVGAVVGGGLLGLEAAGALRALGLRTHVVEAAPRLMPLQVDEGGGQALARHIRGLGVMVHTGAMTERIEAAPDGRVGTLRLAGGTEVDADVVVFAAGVRPRDELARACGLAVGERGGVLVDQTCRTDDEAVWAVGECAAVQGRAYGLVAPGYAMAEVVADRLLGGEAVFTDPDTSTKLKLLGVDVASIGDAHAATEGALELVWADQVAGVYKKLVVTDDASTLLGAVLVGDAADYAALRPLLGRETGCPPEQLILPTAEPSARPALPDDAQVCSCRAVTKGEVVQAVRAGRCSDVASVKACTGAGTGCGSCVPMLKSLLAEAGVTADPALCEHFAMTRKELFEVVAATGIRTFSELVERHGKGRGCDICKPVVASILASLGTGHVLDGEQAALQDSNDHHLANLQKDGTYSVVPRIPGGEITPDRLIVIGEVARDFGLYTKVTGGQRIDLLGARVEQLPAIWRRLVDAGFESGHAYGKALRTVKSCVGSTWCRYGVQDSVGLAIALELRYRGLRAPHKLKGGVSGCARECAEARSKDFGVIATENGWNLYLGGNGGFSPRHAELFVQDVDTDTLITYLDRFLMLYVRTADRLQRTARWIEDMDGGLEHLRAVIVDDSLGVCADLDAAMARHVAGYEDEWRAVLDDPERLSRFASFANAPDAPDPDVVVVAERGQPRPATPAERAVLVAGPSLEVAR